jgi:hypothetical protein
MEADALRHLLQFLRNAVAGVLVLFGTVLPAIACTEQTMLDFIGSLEAPLGYNQVYSGVSVQPPRPVTTMTVDEVLEWQSLASQTSVSSAAGRYQVIRSTLLGLVEQGVVSRYEAFDEGAQDRIGAHLLRQTGYRNGETSPAVANRIAGIWAALPQVSGSGAGFSAYEGYAGNHALVTAETYMGVLQCSVSVDEAASQATVVRAGERIGFEFDRIIEVLQQTSNALTDTLPPVALWILFTLAVADVVLVIARVLLRGGRLQELLQDMAFRLLTLGFLMFVITSIGPIVYTVANVGVGIGEQITGANGVSLASYARAKTVLIFSFSEGGGMLPTHLFSVVYAIGLVIGLLTGLIMGLVVYAYAQLFIGSVIGVLAAGLGGLTATRDSARALVFQIIGGGLRILTLMIIMYLGLSFAQGLRGSVSGFNAAFISLFVDIFVLFLCWQLPSSTARLSGG